MNKKVIQVEVYSKSMNASINASSNKKVLTPEQEEQFEVQMSIDQIFDRGCHEKEKHIGVFVKALISGLIDKDQLKKDLLAKAEYGKEVSDYSYGSTEVEKVFKKIDEEFSTPLRDAPLKINDKDIFKKAISKGRLHRGE